MTIIHKKVITDLDQEPQIRTPSWSNPHPNHANPKFKREEHQLITINKQHLGSHSQGTSCVNPTLFRLSIEIIFYVDATVFEN